MGYRLSITAAADLTAIANYGDEQFGVAQSNKYRDSLKTQFELLGSNPFLYRERYEIMPPVRICPHLSHVIVYTIRANEVVILRIRHGRENWLD